MSTSATWVADLKLRACLVRVAELFSVGCVLMSIIGCGRPSPPPQRPVRRTECLAPGLLAHLAVLRRPPGRLDDVASQEWFQALGHARPRLFGGPPSPYTRLVGSVGPGSRVFLLPLHLPASNDCPGGARHRGQLALTLMFVRRDGVGGGGVGADLRTVLRGGAIASSGDERGTDVAGLVPDGVADVHVRFSDGEIERRRVRNNVWLTHLPTGRSSEARRIIWLDAAGRRIRVSHPLQ